MADSPMSREDLIWKLMCIVAEAEGKELGLAGGQVRADRDYILKLAKEIDYSLRAPGS